MTGVTSAKKRHIIFHMSHWNKLLSQWSVYTPPLTPHPEDISFYKEIIGAGGKGLLLGVTKELRHISADLTCIDNNIDMIKDLEGALPAFHADWLEMPFENETFDFVIGDGVLTCLAIAQYPHFFSEIRRVLKTGGSFAFRAFTTPEEKESTEDVFKTPGANFHAFKWRIAQSFPTPDASVKDILAAVGKYAPDRSKLPFAPELVNTINIYENSKVSYSFPTLPHLRSFFGLDWDEKSLKTGTYDLAERCPVIGLQKRA